MLFLHVIIFLSHENNTTFVFNSSKLLRKNNLKDAKIKERFQKIFKKSCILSLTTNLNFLEMLDRIHMLF
jgi:hypothetical protein